MLDAGRESFVAYDRRPVRHGMTVGELAMLYRGEKNMPLDLSVVRMEGWRRGDLFDATGPEVDEPLAEHPQPDGGAALSGHRPLGDDKSFGRPRHADAL